MEVGGQRHAPAALLQERPGTHCIGGCVGRDSSVGIETRYWLDGLGIESRRGGEIFHTRPDRPWGPPSLLYNGYRVFPGVKRPGRGVDHPTSI